MLSTHKELIKQIDRVIQRYKKTSEQLKQKLQTANKNEIIKISYQIKNLDKTSKKEIISLCDRAYIKAKENKHENDEQEILKIKNNLFINALK